MTRSLERDVLLHLDKPCVELTVPHHDFAVCDTLAHESGDGAVEGYVDLTGLVAMGKPAEGDRMLST